MTLRLDWLGLAEGSTIDLRGNLTLVGFNPHVLVLEEFPSNIAPHFIFLVEEDSDDPDPVLVKQVTVSLQVRLEGPAGEVLFLIDAPPQPTVSKQWPDIPQRVQIIAQLPFVASTPGAYRVFFTAKVMDGNKETSRIEAFRKFHILHPSLRLDATGSPQHGEAL